MGECYTIVLTECHSLFKNELVFWVPRAHCPQERLVAIFLKYLDGHFGAGDELAALGILMGHYRAIEVNCYW